MRAVTDELNCGVFRRASTMSGAYLAGKLVVKREFLHVVLSISKQSWQRCLELATATCGICQSRMNIVLEASQSIELVSVPQ